MELKFALTGKSCADCDEGLRTFLADGPCGRFAVMVCPKCLNTKTFRIEEEGK